MKPLKRPSSVKPKTKNMKYINILICLLTWVGAHTVCAQSPQAQVPGQVGIEQAIALTLAHNFDIQVASSNAEISRNNATPGNAGFLPTVTADGGFNYANNNTKTEFADPNLEAIDASGAVTETVTANLTVNYTIYNGNSRTINLQRLKNTAYVNELNLRASIEAAVQSAIVQFLQAANTFEGYQIAIESVKLSQKRYLRAKENYNFGNFTRLQLLNAEVDLKADSTNMVQARLQYQNAIKLLNNILGIPPQSQYDIDTVFTFATDYQYESLLNNALQHNTSYLVGRASITDSELGVKLNRAALLPSLNLSGGYSYNNTSYEANFLSSTRSNGLNAGLNLSYTLFDGKNRKRNIQNAIVQEQIQQVNLQKTESTLRTNLLNSYNDFITNTELLQLQQRNLALAQANFQRSQEAFGTGQITGIELREAQLNLINAKYAVSQQRIQTKVSEVSLLYYSGNLVQQ